MLTCPALGITDYYDKYLQLITTILLPINCHQKILQISILYMYIHIYAYNILIQFQVKSMRHQKYCFMCLQTEGG